MPISDIPIFSMLRTKMQWHQERQKILAENVSNADTPKFKPRDLAPLKFESSMPGVSSVAVGGVAVAGTTTGGAGAHRPEPHRGRRRGRAALPGLPQRTLRSPAGRQRRQSRRRDDESGAE